MAESQYQSSKSMEGYRRKSLIVKEERNGAPKGTILELFSAISWQVCQRLSSLLN
jgi:hypothetical protein